MKTKTFKFISVIFIVFLFDKINFAKTNKRMRKKIIFLGLLLFLFGFQSCQNKNKKKQTEGLGGDLIIFHAGSLAVPFKLIADEFEKENPNANVLLEAAGSVACARKITDLKKECDIMASADYQIIDRFLISEYANWNISFAANEMVIAFTDKSRKKDQINSTNWHQILLNADIIYGRSDPNSDPCGYRTVMTMQLTALMEKNPEILKLLDKDQNYMRPKEVDLLGLLEANVLDYIFIYRSVAQQHNLKILSLNDSVNLSSSDLADWYSSAQVDISGKKPGEYENLKGEPMVYGITQLKKAPNPELAKAFMEFFFDTDKGMKIIRDQGQASIIPSKTATYYQIPKFLKKYAKMED